MPDETPQMPVIDPCADYVELRAAYMALLKGASTKKVRFRNGEDERETEFNQANISALKEAMETARQECMALNGDGRPRRFAISVGNNSAMPRRIY